MSNLTVGEFYKELVDFKSRDLETVEGTFFTVAFIYGLLLFIHFCLQKYIKTAKEETDLENVRFRTNSIYRWHEWVVRVMIVFLSGFAVARHLGFQWAFYIFITSTPVIALVKMLNEIFTIVISFFSITVFFSDLPDHARNLVQLPKYFYSSLILVVAQIVLFKEFCMLLWVIIMYFLNIDYAVEYFSHYIGIYTSIQLLFWASILIRYTYREAWHDMDISKQIMAQQAYLLAAFKLPTMMIAFSFFFRVVDNQVFFLMLMTMDMITLPIAVRFFEVYTCFKIMDAVSQKNAIADCNKS